MKIQAVIILTIVVITGLCQGQDISGLLADRRYVEKQINCILERGHCDVIGRQIKGLLPEVLNNNCRRCTPHQVRTAHRLISFMRQSYPNEWSHIVRSYTGTHYVFRG
ncbi:hypothetical protein KM043_010296 [Ampulex compressa]|nr:hypothetical protein KM043_010296 [Ampulex compressa]